MPGNERRSHESGNAFFMVMVGVVLFAALMFTFSRGARQGGENLTEKQAEITATDIITYAQRAERAVSRVYGKALSENDISFENPVVSGYANTNCPATNDRCKVFKADGGGIRWNSAGRLANSGAPWVFTGTNAVPGVGQDTTADLVMILPQVSQGVCLALNEALNIGAMPTDGDDIDTATQFQGSFANTDRISGAAVDGVLSACVLNTAPDPDEYFFYHVLLPR